jgi:hypothetical protein
MSHVRLASALCCLAAVSLLLASPAGWLCEEYFGQKNELPSMADPTANGQPD